MAQAAPPVVVGLVAAPGAAARLTTGLCDDLAAELAVQHPEVAWQVRAVEDGLVQPPAARSPGPTVRTGNSRPPR